MTENYVMVPVPGYLTMQSQPRFMIGMLGMRVEEHEVHHFLERTGYYDRAARPPNEGHWFSIVDPGHEEYFVGGEEVPEGEERPAHKYQKGDFVAINLSARDHMLTLGRERLSFMPTKEVIGVMHLGDKEHGMRFDTVGYWVLVEQDDIVATKISGASTIVLADSTLEFGQRSSESIKMTPGDKKEPGIRVKYSRVVDAGKLQGCKIGDVVCYSASAGCIELTIGGKKYTAMPTGSVLGVLSSEQFPNWVAQTEKTA